MINRVIIYTTILILLCGIAAQGQAIDTTRQLKLLVSELKGLKDMSYDYEMSISFPNGDHDHMKGVTYMNNDEWVYYNDCDAYEMLYTQKWLYKADHRKKILTIVDMNKDYNKKLKKATERDIFKNGAVTGFLDSIMLKTAIVKRLKTVHDTLSILLEFPRASEVKEMNVVYDIKGHLPVKYDMVVYHPWQKTPKGIQVIETKITCSSFKKVTEKGKYSEDGLFSYKTGKLELKKYKNYTITTKM
ncbi:MAG: hypothetical protein JWQ38_2544 [Flavipsychrobacter sp.]|nr:hypothetical protein [Flavipsychrobacter sp.]